MKNLINFLVITIVVIFSVTNCKKTVADEEMLRLLWDYNPPADSVIYYNVFIYETSDTNTTPFVDGVYPDSIRQYQIGSANEDSLKSLYPDTAEYHFSTPSNGWWVQAALTAVNQWAESGVAVSGWYKKEYKITPGKPNNLVIKK